MAPITTASDESNHQELMDKLDIFSVRKSFRNPSFKAPQRRNKNVKQIISEASRRELNAMLATNGNTQNNSGVSTPVPDVNMVDSSANMTGDATPAATGRTVQPDLAKASRNLAVIAAENAAASGTAPVAPTVSYTNIEAAPSLHPSSQRHYCDITGLPAPYTDPKSRLRYHNSQMFGIVRTLGQHPIESYLAARGAHVVLK